MREYLTFYIDDKWVAPAKLATLDVTNPATEQVCGKIALGSAADVDTALKAARRVFATWSQTSREQRLAVLQRIAQEYQKRTGDLAAAITEEMGREEIFGPVLAILGYDNIDQAIEIANDTEYGLAGYVAGADVDKARAVARKIRAGWVVINGGFDFNAPFGGYKKSGNGREWGELGFQEYVETKSILGYASNATQGEH